MLIFDVGMHHGEDTEYYLKKAERVVGIEANPRLCEQIRDRFEQDIRQERLIVINKGVADEAGTLPFYVVGDDAPQSSFQKRPGARPIDVDVVKLSSLFKEYGTPDFAKIDVEHYDAIVLTDLIGSGQIPQRISVEAHKFEVLLLLYRAGYQQFRLINCRDIARKYSDHPIKTRGGFENFSFKHPSSGPFGEDLPDKWVTIEQVCAQWFVRHSLLGGGWYDVHARRLNRDVGARKNR